METAVGVEKQKTVFPHQLAKRLLAFRTVPTGPTAVKQQNNKTGHFICYQNRTFSLATDMAPYAPVVQCLHRRKSQNRANARFHFHRGISTEVPLKSSRPILSKTAST